MASQPVASTALQAVPVAPMWTGEEVQEEEVQEEEVEEAAKPRGGMKERRQERR